MAHRFQGAAGSLPTTAKDAGQCVFNVDMQQRANMQVARRLAESGERVLRDQPGQADA